MSVSVLHHQDWDLERAEGFMVYPLAVLSPNTLRWIVMCGHQGDYTSDVASTIVTVNFLSVTDRNTTNRFVRAALQKAVDDMWSRWEAL